jgi:RHS repeat-associated protein
MRLRSRSKPPHKARDHRQYRTTLEPLEDRLMLSTLRWTNPAGGDWDTASNWVNTADPNDHHVPTSADDAQINTGGITVAHSSTSNDSIHSLTSQAALSISNGSLSIAAASTIGELDFAGGTLTGAGALTVTGALNWTGGTMSGTGTTTVAQGGTLDLAGNPNLDARTLINAGTATYSLVPGALNRFSMVNSATFDNLAGATFTIAGDVPLVAYGTAPVAFNNAGTLIRTGGTATGAASFSGIALNNTGSVQVQSGTLDLAGGGDSTGSFTLAAGATLTFDTGGTQTLEAASRVNGSGTVLFEGGTVNVGGTYDLGAAGNTHFTFGTAHFTSPVASLGKRLVIDGGTADLESGAPVTVSELDLAYGTLTGSGNLNVTDALNWTGGTMSGLGTTTLAAGATSNLSGNLYLDARTLVNAGTAIWSGDGTYDALRVNDGATIDNLAGATFTITNDRSLGQFYPVIGAAVFNNAGLLVKTGGTGETSFVDVELHNKGVLSIQSGSVDVENSLVIDGSGALTEQPGTSLELGVGNPGSLTGTTTNASQFKPDGTVVFKNYPQVTSQLEAMSQDLGNLPAGWAENFAYNTLEIDGYVKLVDNAQNAAKVGREALYVNTLIVAQYGGAFDLNGLHVYARAAQINGTILNGTVSIASSGGGGSIALNSSEPGDLAMAGQVDDWDFYGRAGRSVAAIVHTGALGTPAPTQAPALNWANVMLLDPSGHVVATAENTQSGGDASILDAVLPSDGVYHVRVEAPSDHSSSTGNYVLSVYAAPVHEFPLTLNEQVNSQLNTPVSLDRWNFSAAANEQVQLHIVAASSPEIEFDLSGPGGFVGFTGLTADSGPVTLPTSGSYTLTAHLAGQEQTGAYAFEMERMPIGLTLGTPFTQALAGSGQTQLFDVQVPIGSPLQVRLTDSQASDQNELYVKFGAAPTRADYDYRYSTAAASNQAVTVAQAAPGTWYILVYAASVSAPGSYTITAVASGLFLSQVSPAELGTTRDDTLSLIGAGFNASTTVSLVAAGGAMYPARAVNLISPTSLTATFSAGSVPAGLYSVRVASSDGESAALSDAFTVVEGGQADLQFNLVVPSVLAVHWVTAGIELEYSNTGTDAMPAPILLLTATAGSNQDAFLTLDATIVHSGIWNRAVPDGFNSSVQVLASGATAGLLQPDESEQVPVYWAGWLASEWSSTEPIIFELSAVTADNTTPIDWSALKTSLQPPDIAPAAWNALYPNLVARLGSTWGQYVTRMDADAAFLASVGDNVTDLSQLFTFEVQLADGLSPVSTPAAASDASVPSPGLSLSVDRVFSNSITSRYQTGPFGQGWWWVDGWQQRLSVESDGTVVIADGDGSERRFQPDLRGGFFDDPGDHATLTQLTSGGYILTETHGLVTGFRSDGAIDYVQDTNGNRITAGYTNGLLTSLNHSSGQSLQIAYNSAGLIKSITDPATGHTTTYTYDPSNQYLMSVTTFDQRTTTYSYDTGSNPATLHALLSITNPDNTHEYFVYDLQGRLKDTHRDGGAEDVAYSYGPAGAVAATDAAGGTTTYSFDHSGRIAKLDDALHHDTLYSYCACGDLTQITDATGQYYKYAYNSNGDLTQITDPLGHTVSVGYAGPFDRLISSTDQNGNTTQYGYDSQGNLASTTYADGTVERMTYDALGDPKTLTNRRGHVIQYSYDTSGRLASETFADGSQMTYHYEGNTLSYTTDPSGTTTLTYYGDDQLKQITYPDGSFLHYSYDAGGRRSQMVDQTGFTVNYSYDAVGRLAKLTDGTGALVDQYSYYDDGRLKREDKGNGTYTTYEHDLAGELLHLVNYVPDGSVNSRFDYTYDDLGNRKTMTTLDGQWTYTYDAIGELTHAVFASNKPSAVPNQDLQYSYDPAGNRIQTIINGVTTNYVPNNLNQYTVIGNETLRYDGDGNLSSMSAGSQTSTYTFNDANQLVAASTPAGTSTSQYDALGFRVATSANGQVTRYVIDPTGLGNVVGMYDANGGLIAHFAYGPGLVSRVDASGGASYFDFDALGSTAGLSGSNGHYQNLYRYLPYGGLVGASEAVANPFQFVGQAGVMTDHSGLEFMRARFYTSGAGRFLSQDPLGVAGGQSGLYVYANNNSVIYSDPSGLFCFSRRDKIKLIRGYHDSIEAKKLLLKIAENYDEEILTLREEEKAEQDIEHLKQQITEEREILELIRATEICKPEPEPEKPLRPPGNGEKKKQSTLGDSHDPNDSIGPGGYGPQDFIAPGGPLPYRIDFENEARATAPAQQVIVTDQLDSNFDWKTFELTGVGFGDTNIVIPPGSQHFLTTVDVTENGQPIEVDIEIGLNPQTGLVTATFQTIDPRTQLPPDGLTGFLPPEDGTGRGQGYFTYLISPKAGLATGTPIRNIASVVFDTNPPITTDQKDDNDPSKGVDPAKQDLITIDAGPPTSTVAPLPAKETSANFTVNWSGQDDPGGSGIASYDVEVSDNGGPFVPFLTGTTQTSATFAGVNAHTYGFLSVATDNVGNIQPTPATAQATTKVVVSTSPGTPQVGSITTPVHAIRAGASAAVSASFTETPANGPHTAIWSWGDGKTSAGKVTEPKGSGSGTVTGSHIYANPGIYRVTLTVTDAHKHSGKATAAQYVIVYNPSGGSITGNGTITSPPGAVPGNPKLTGKASFQLNAGYAANSAVPSGKLVLTFQAANVSFQSTSLDWLVVSGGTAWYEGTGTLNGSGTYGFLAAASSGGAGTGKLRVRIWNKATGAILYDTQPGAPIPAAPTTHTTSGSIVFRIPKPGKRHQRATALSVAIPGLDLRRRGEKTQSVVKARP